MFSSVLLHCGSHAELLDGAELLPLVPRLTFVLDDISHLSDEALHERGLGALPALARGPCEMRVTGSGSSRRYIAGLG